MNGWHRMKDDPPKRDGRYLIYIAPTSSMGLGVTVVAKRSGNKWLAAQPYAEFVNVTHWQELPLPPI